MALIPTREPPGRSAQTACKPAHDAALRSTLSPMRGPADEKLATRANPAFGIVPALLAIALAGAGGFRPEVPPVSAAVSADRMPKNGIVTPAIGPSNGG